MERGKNYKILVSEAQILLTIIEIKCVREDLKCRHAQAPFTLQGFRVKTQKVWLRLGCQFALERHETGVIRKWAPEFCKCFSIRCLNVKRSALQLQLTELPRVV